MGKFHIKVRVDVDDTYDHVHNLFKHKCVSIMFYHSFVPPHYVEYIIGPLTETGVTNWKNRFDELGCKYQVEVRQVND